ncbi:MAG: agmatinase family protein [Bacteroidales bacterium]
MSFNSENIGIPNGNFFGLPIDYTNSKVVLLPVAWDATTSYRKGTAQAPKAMLEASCQIDLFDVDFGEFWKAGIYTADFDEKIEEMSYTARKDAEKVIALLENGVDLFDKRVVARLKFVNVQSKLLNTWVYEQTKAYLGDGKLIGVVGGDHSVPFGFMKAISEVHENFGVLHIDAHADLRDAYEGFEFSHASIMHNALNCFSNIKKIVQVGVRDLSKTEHDFAVIDSRIVQFTDSQISSLQFCGKNWAQICAEIVKHLPQKVYLSFDIDGLSADLCPNTGTPVPGGLQFQQAIFLLKELIAQKKTIVGFDLCEVNVHDTANEWDAIVGARVLYKLIGSCITSM